MKDAVNMFLCRLISACKFLSIEMLKMQSRPSQYSIPPSSGALQRASYGSTYPDLASGCNSYYNTQQQQHSNPAATLLHYNLPPITSYNSYSYYDGGVETTSNNPPGMQNENPNSPNVMSLI